jgi:CRISPR-associated protein Cas2
MKTTLSGYQVMWMFVMFDLPTEEKIQRKKYREFRNTLLDIGFKQLQYSVYIKLAASKETAQKMERIVQNALPENGDVNVFCITDKQYESIKSFTGRKKKPKNNEAQLVLF